MGREQGYALREGPHGPRTYRDTYVVPRKGCERVVEPYVSTIKGKAYRAPSDSHLGRIEERIPRIVQGRPDPRTEKGRVRFTTLNQYRSRSSDYHRIPTAIPRPLIDGR